MMPLPTAVLCHTCRDNTHYDWLLTVPADPTGHLWTARTSVHPMHWSTVRAFTLQPIQPHRRVYLKHQGPVSGNRGSVTRVDEGTMIAMAWLPGHRMIHLHTRHLKSTVRLRRTSPTLWVAQVM